MSRAPSRIEKKTEVREVFSSIVSRYDFLNTALSLGRHAAWRRLAVSEMRLAKGGCALDVCCGTGDLAFEMAWWTGSAGRVIGVDFCEPMIEQARLKAARNGHEWVSFTTAEADRLPFADSAFDGAAIAFGLRNVPDAHAAISEMARVVKPGGRIVSLEIVGVRSGLAGILWDLYFHVLAPRVARILGGRGRAYDYLSRSVAEFMPPEELAAEFEKCGLQDVKTHPLALGGVYVHAGTKHG